MKKTAFLLVVGVIIVLGGCTNFRANYRGNVTVAFEPTATPVSPLPTPIPEPTPTVDISALERYWHSEGALFACESLLGTNAQGCEIFREAVAEVMVEIEVESTGGTE